MSQTDTIIIIIVDQLRDNWAEKLSSSPSDEMNAQ
jgi:hypothetical protein